MKTLPPVARNIYVFCKKCETDRYFKVLTHTSLTTAKLKCEVCGCSRNYSMNDGDTKPSTKPRTTAKDSTRASSSTWQTMKEGYKGPPATVYSINYKFKDNESVEHPTFGLGFVTKAHSHKIEVLFSVGIKELMHAKTQPV